eukprot:gene11052-biopygen9385
MEETTLSGPRPIRVRCHGDITPPSPMTPTPRFMGDIWGGRTPALQGGGRGHRYMPGCPLGLPLFGDLRIDHLGPAGARAQVHVHVDVPTRTTTFWGLACTCARPLCGADSRLPLRPDPHPDGRLDLPPPPPQIVTPCWAQRAYLLRVYCCPAFQRTTSSPREVPGTRRVGARESAISCLAAPRNPAPLKTPPGMSKGSQPHGGTGTPVCSPKHPDAPHIGEFTHSFAQRNLRTFLPW